MVDFSLQYIISIAILTPFAIIGIYKAVTKLIEIVKVRKLGYIKIFMFTKNSRIKHKLVKPVEDQIQIGKTKYNFVKGVGVQYFNDNIPTICFEEGAADPLNIHKIAGEGAVAPGRLNKLLLGAFLNGMIVATQEKKFVNMLLMVAALAGAIAAASNVYMLQQLIPFFDALPQIISKLG